MAAIFLVSGVGKLAATVEVVGGVLLLVGYRTRAVALALALFTIATAPTFHTAFGDRNQWIHVLEDLAMAGGPLQVAAFGAGAFSADARRVRA